MKHFNFYSWFLVLLFSISCVGTSQADELVTYKLQQVSSVTAGEKYVFVQSERAMTTCSNGVLQTTDQFSMIGLVGNENYVWTLETTDGGFYMKNVSADKYLKNGNNNTTDVSMANGGSQSVWAFTFTDDIAKITKANESDRYLGFVSASDCTYRAYKNGKHPQDITVYQLVEETRTITWQSNGEDFITTIPLYGKISLPATNPDPCYSSLDEFVGWSKKQPAGASWTVQPTFIQENDPVDDALNVTYYAVFKSKNANKWYTACPDVYAITYNANGGTGDDQVVYYEKKTDVTSYDGSAFSKDGYSLYQWNTATDGTGDVYKPNATISLSNLVGDGRTGTLYAQWTGKLNVSGNVHLTSGKGIAVYTTAAAGNLITVSSPAIDMVHHIRYKFLDSENIEVTTLKLCNNGTDNFNQLSNITTDGLVGAYEQTFSICYTPTEYDQSATYTLLLEGVDKGGNTVFNSCSLAVEVRSLPEEFVIAIKKDNQWYAVPNVLATSSSASAAEQPYPLLIDVDDNKNPTYVILSDNATNSLYKSAGRFETTQHRGAIRFQSVFNNNYITATTTNNTYFYMKPGNDQNQQFYLTSADCNTYKVTLDPADYPDNTPTRWISFYGDKIGWYNTKACDVYILPVKQYVTIREDVNPGTISGICFERDIIAHMGATFYYLSQKASDESYIELTEVTGVLHAGYPYLFEASANEIKVIFDGEAVTEANHYNGLYGTFVNQELGDGYCIILNNKYYRTHTGNNNGCYAHRAYLKLDDVSYDQIKVAPGETEESATAPRRIRLGGDGVNTPTGWDNILNVNAERVQKLIINDKMYIFRNGKMYDATGKFVK